MDKIKLAHLKELAQKATQGNWFVACNTKGQLLLNSEAHDRFESTIAVLPDNHYGDKNADYLAAANPSVILNMIESYQDKEEALYGVFVLVDKLRDMLKLQEPSLEETIKAAIAMIDRLEKEADWLAKQLTKFDEIPCPEHPCSRSGKDGCLQCWREAARKAVEEKSEANSGTN